ncbi:MAG: hypothetical protein WC151_08090 [Bacteroidales bacterium]|nr:hypothetical protein [Bacteroidales bacterium]
MQKKFFLALFVFVSLTATLYSQEQPLRIEFECDPGVEPYVEVPCGIYGVTVFYPTLEELDDYTTWKFILLDVNLKPIWTIPYKISNNLKFRHSGIEENKLYLAFSKSGKTNEETNLQVLRIDLKNGNITDQKASIEGRPGKSAMTISRNAVLIGVEKSKGSASLLFLDFNTMTQSILPFTLDNNHKLLAISFNTTTNTYCLISAYETGKATESLDCYYWKPLSENYDSINIIGFDENRLIKSAQWIAKGDSIELIIGGFIDYSRSKGNYLDDYGTRFSGLFSYNLKNSTLSFFPLNTFDNIYSLITATDLQKTKKSKKKAANNTPEIDLFLIFHEAKLYNDEIILLTENYRPQFHTVSSMSYDYYGRPLTTYYDVFDGFRYSNAIVCAFDLNGKLTWTNKMDIRDVLLERNKKITTLVKDDDFYVMAYAGLGNVASQVIKEKEIVENITVTKVDFLYTRDQLLDVGKSHIRHWYGSYFLVSGYQTIRNNRVTSSGKRTVFYLSKMAYK